MIVITVPILLQEVVLEKTCNIKRNLVWVAKRGFAHKLHDLIQVLGIRKKLPDTVSEAGELGMIFLVVFVKYVGIFTVRLRGIYGREMLSLGKLFIETPEHCNGSAEYTMQASRIERQA